MVLQNRLGCFLHCRNLRTHKLISVNDNVCAAFLPLFFGNRIETGWYEHDWRRLILLTELLNELCYAVVNMYETFCEYPEIRILQIRQEDEPDGATPTAKVTADGAWFGTLINIQFAFDEVK